MVDISVDTENKSARELIGQGIRAFILQEFSSAVTALSKASEILVADYGDDQHDSLADLYLYYGKSLLELSREESDALGDAVPKKKEEGSDDSDDEVEKTETEDGDEKEEDSKEEENEEVKEDKKEKIEESKEGESASTSTSKNGEASEPDEDTNEKPNDDEPTDLQVAWEVLELAKKIYLKRGAAGRKNLAEALVVLGEISLENENCEAAITDIKEGLRLQKELFGNDSRTIAETYYKLGMAYSTNSQFDNAIQSFNHSLEYLRNRIGVLEKMMDEMEKTEKDNDKENDKDNDAESELKYSAEDEVADEIKEIKSLIPDLEEKIADMKTYKDETLKEIMSAVKESKPSGDAASSSELKPASDISHLVKRKRKLDEIVEESEKESVESPAKKPPV